MGPGSECFSGRQAVIQRRRTATALAIRASRRPTIPALPNAGTAVGAVHGTVPAQARPEGPGGAPKRDAKIPKSARLPAIPSSSRSQTGGGRAARAIKRKEIRVVLVGVAVLVEVCIAAVPIAIQVRVELLGIRRNYAVVGRVGDVISVYVIGPTRHALT
jgi:hypothetical protein